MHIFLHVYIYIPGTCLSSNLEVELFKAKSFPMKARVIWVPGIYVYMFIYFYIYISLATGFPVLIQGCIIDISTKRSKKLVKSKIQRWTNEMDQTREPAVESNRWQVTGAAFLSIFLITGLGADVVSWRRTARNAGRLEEKTPTLFVFLLNAMV